LGGGEDSDGYNSLSKIPYLQTSEVTQPISTFIKFDIATQPISRFIMFDIAMFYFGTRSKEILSFRIAVQKTNLFRRDRPVILIEDWLIIY